MANTCRTVACRRKDRAAQQPGFCGIDIPCLQRATPAGRAGAFDDCFLHLADGIVLEFLRDILGDFENADQGLKLGHGTQLAVGIDLRHQPSGVGIIDIALGGDLVDDEFADRLDEEIGPTGTTFGKLAIESEDRFGLVLRNHAIRPRTAAQLKQFVRTDTPIFGDTARQNIERRIHKYFRQGPRIAE